MLAARCGDGTAAPTELCDGDTRSCTSLSALYAGGEARCRNDCSGYDVSTCQRDPERLTKVETVRPAARSLRHTNARCNAGEAFTFQVRLASPPSKDWVVHLEGGGACDDVAVLCGVRAGCLLQHSDPLFHGPTFGDRQVLDRFPEFVGGVLSRDSAINPLASANHVYAFYCSSDNWSGTRTSAIRTTDVDPAGFGPWYFAGHHNVTALFESLSEAYGLDDSDPEMRVLFTGTSAGGVGIVANTEHVASMLPRTAAGGRYRVVVDAGTYLGRSSADGPTLGWDLPECGQVDPQLEDEQVLTLAMKGIWAGAPGEECVKANPDAPGRCYMSNHAKDIWRKQKIPFLVQQGQLDLSWMAIYTGEAPRAATPFGRLQQKYFAERLVAQLEGMPWVFAGGERRIFGLGNYHTLVSYDLGLLYCDPVSSFATCDGRTFGDLLRRFWAASPGDPGERMVAVPKIDLETPPSR